MAVIIDLTDDSPTDVIDLTEDDDEDKTADKKTCISTSKNNDSSESQLAAIRRLRAEQYDTYVESQPRRREPLALVTYNVWFSYEETFSVRMDAIAGSIRDCHVACFQEVTDGNEKFLRQGLEDAGYHAFLASQTTRAPYRCAMASKNPAGKLVGVRTVEFPNSRMGRGLLLARTSWDGQNIVIGCAHLESFDQDKDGTRRERADQLRRSLAALDTEAQAFGSATAVFMGDTNWEGPLTLPAGWTDAWEHLGSPRDSQFTYDGPRNPMLYNRYRHRFDRIFFKIYSTRTTTLRGTTSSSSSSSSSFKPSSLCLLGADEVIARNFPTHAKGNIDLAPSDHFGLKVLFDCDSSTNNNNNNNKRPRDE